MSLRKYIVTTFAAILFGMPLAALAHEVYLLTPDQINTLEATDPIPLIDIFFQYASEAILWAILIGFLIVSVFVISISATLENKFDRYLIKLKRFAPFIARVTVGLAFMSCAYHASLFGPELPFNDVFGRFASLMQVLFAAIGAAMIFGVYSRATGLFGLAVFAAGVLHYGVYMTTYLNYFTEFLVLILIGGHKFAVAHEQPKTWSLHRLFDYISNQYGELAFFFLRVGFGISLIFSSVYAKIIHNQLALAIVTEYDLVSVFHLPAEFIVLGAALVEILLGVMFILGIEIRFNAIVINIFLTLSLLYFGEAVWPHVILIGIPIAFFCYGYDKYSLEGYFFKQGNREPIF